MTNKEDKYERLGVISVVICFIPIYAVSVTGGQNDKWLIILAVFSSITFYFSFKQKESTPEEVNNINKKGNHKNHQDMKESKQLPVESKKVIRPKLKLKNARWGILVFFFINVVFEVMAGTRGIVPVAMISSVIAYYWLKAIVKDKGVSYDTFWEGIKYSSYALLIRLSLFTLSFLL